MKAKMNKVIQKSKQSIINSKMSTAPPTSLYKDLVAFFEERGLSEVASGLKQDLKTINYNK